jgi:drug/metabolite transporter (DMT)-like permease
MPRKHRGSPVENSAKPVYWPPLAWLCLVLSIGAISAMYVLIRRGAAAEVASLFFLVPPTTAVIAWALFNETLDPLSLGGMALVVLAVAMVTYKGRR